MAVRRARERRQPGRSRSGTGTPDPPGCARPPPGCRRRSRPRRGRRGRRAAASRRPPRWPAGDTPAAPDSRGSSSRSAPRLPRAAGRLADEQAVAARQPGGAARVVRADDLYLGDARVAFLELVLSVRVRRAVERQRQNPFRQRGAPVEGEADLVPARGDGCADLEPLVGVQRVQLPFGERARVVDALELAGVAHRRALALLPVAADRETADALAVHADVELVRPAEAAHVAVLLLPQAEADDVLAVDREVVLDGDAPARSERQVVADGAVLVHRAVDGIDLGHRAHARVAHDELADAPRRGQVALDQGRRDGQHLGDVVEALLLVVGREQRVGVDLEAEDVADGVGVLHPVEAVHGGPARVGILQARAVELGLEPMDEVAGCRGRGARPAGGRHRVRPQAADDVLPGGRVRLHVRDVQRVQRQPGRERAPVVAGHAVAVEEGPRLRGAGFGGGPGFVLRGGARLRAQVELRETDQGCQPHACECPACHRCASAFSQRMCGRATLQREACFNPGWPSAGDGAPADRAASCRPRSPCPGRPRCRPGSRPRS